MLLVETELRVSPIHGLGCFATQDIPWGKPVWRLTPGFDVIWTELQWLLLPIWQRVKLSEHAYLDKELGFWIYCADDARFFNHLSSDKCNIAWADSFTDIAGRDIKAGEELTCDYNKFCHDALDLFGNLAK